MDDPGFFGVWVADHPHLWVRLSNRGVSPRAVQGTSDLVLSPFDGFHDGGGTDGELYGGVLYGASELELFQQALQFPGEGLFVFLLGLGDDGLFDGLRLSSGDPADPSADPPEGVGAFVGFPDRVHPGGDLVEVHGLRVGVEGTIVGKPGRKRKTHKGNAKGKDFGPFPFIRV